MAKKIAKPQNLQSVTDVGATTTKNINVLGIVATGDIRNTAWTDYSATSSVEGWAATPTKNIFYKKIGKLVFVTYNITGTSNATNAQFSVPFAVVNSGVDLYLPIARAVDNTGAATLGIVRLTPNSVTIILYPIIATGAWTASGTKGSQGQFWYEATA